MELYNKSLNRDEFTIITKKNNKSMIVDSEEFCGTIGYLKMLDVKKTGIVKTNFGEIIVADKGYVWLQFAPKNKHHWITVMFDDNGKLIQIYFDITKENIFDDETNPYFIDMKLDVVIIADNDPYVIDQDELEEALKENLITVDEYNLALKEADEIISNYNKNKKDFLNIIKKYYKKIEK